VLGTCVHLLLQWVFRNKISNLPADLSGLDDSFLDSLDKDIIVSMCTSRGLNHGSSRHKDRPLSLLKKHRDEMAFKKEEARLARTRIDEERANQKDPLRSNLTSTLLDSEVAAEQVETEHTTRSPCTCKGKKL